jgi:hypothetical protein
MPVVGFLDSRSPDDAVASRLRAFRQGLKETGYVEGENVAIVFRWAGRSSVHHEGCARKAALPVPRRAVYRA